MNETIQNRMLALSVMALALGIIAILQMLRIRRELRRLQAQGKQGPKLMQQYQMRFKKVGRVLWTAVILGLVSLGIRIASMAGWL